jgi:adenylate cyclase
MASIFLSYAREDVKKAERLAGCLEAAGHSVWWDTQIQGGARFGAAIDAALEAADAVVVLWSSASVNSAWVQDEAAAGRDSQRLVPLLIEPVQPPLGFRQYQSLSIASWTGRGAPREMPRILSAIASLKGAPDAALAPQNASRASTDSHRGLIIAAALVATVIALVTGGLFWSNSSASAAPSVTVAASRAAPAQPSIELAHNVALDLGRFQAGPLSGLTISELHQGESRNTDYRIEVGVAPAGAGLHADVALLDRNNRVLWTTAVDAPARQSVDLRQRASAQVGAVLACIVHTPAMRPRPVGDVLNLYLAGCARLSDASADRNDQDILVVFRRITEKEPRLAEGWAGLALIESRGWANANDAAMNAAIETARNDLRRARQINPNLDMVYAAEGQLIVPWDRNWWIGPLEAFDRGLKANPDSALLYSLRANTLLSVGRMNEAVESARRAVELDPLSTTVRDMYISSLAYAGHTAAAERELKQAEQIWPGSAVIENMRYRFDLRFGDAANALRLMRDRGDLIGVPDDPAFEAFSNARISPTTTNEDKAVASFLDAYRRNPDHIFGYLQALATFNRVDQAFDLVKPDSTLIYLRFASDLLWRPDTRSIRADPRFIGLANRMGFVRLWRQTKVWPDFCEDPQLTYDCRKEAAKYPAVNPVFSPPPQEPA